MFADIIRYITTIISLITNKYEEKTAQDGLLECSKAIRRIKKALKNAVTMGEKQNLLASLANITTLRNQLKLEIKTGAGLKTRRETATNRVHWDDSISAFDSRIRTGVISNLKHKDPRAFLTDCRALFRKRILNALKIDESLKVNTAFSGEFEIVKGDRLCTEHKYFTTSNTAIYRDTDLNKWFENYVMDPIVKQLEEFQERDSGWSLKAIVNLGVNINKFVPQRGSSYIELPSQIKRKQACINVKNSDTACFAWAIVSALYPVPHGKRSDDISSYPDYSKVLNLKGIHFPMTINQIRRFEQQNDVSVNVYTLKLSTSKYTVVPLRLGLEKNKSKHVNLLMVQDEYFDESRKDPINVHSITSSTKTHFVWIKDLSRLVSKQLNKHTEKKYFCDRCFHYFYTQAKLDEHLEDCLRTKECLPRLPEKGKNILAFKNFRNKIESPFVIYADLESVLLPMQDGNKYQQHIPASIGYYVKCSYDDSLSFYRAFRGEDCMKWFAKEIKQFAEDVATVFQCSFDIDMSAEQEVEFRTATHCHICEQPFVEEDKKVRDHNHLIYKNNYRGPAHNECNINYQDDQTIPIIFHNLSGYDAHFIIKNIALDIDGTIDLLPITKEKYISFTKNISDSKIHFRFIDSFRFMNSSLDTLASYLPQYPILSSQFSSISEEKKKILTKKGIMPYDYIDSFARFDEECLPPIETFYNKLEDKPCPRRSYARAKMVWDTFNMKTLGEYTDLYLKTDVMLLADVFEQFRSSCRKTYGLDPAHYFTLPGYTWDAMLYKTKQQLELLTDVDQLLFFEKGTRGGLSQVCSKRQATANNKYMNDEYDTSKPDSYLMYFDVNNQYGWAMSQYLPYGGFEWVDTNIDVTSVPDDASEGYTLEVDLEYPNNLHDSHKDLPFCPNHMDPKTGKSRAESKPDVKHFKLMATLQPKKNYVIHYRNLKQALANGLILTKIHRVLKYKQSAWLKPYIDLNTRLRTAAQNDFEKNLFKLMNNAVFGKTMENLRKHSDVRLIMSWEGRYGAEARISNPRFKSLSIFDSNLVAIELGKAEIMFNKPIFVGMTVLDLAKLTIYDFHYGYMIPKFGEDCSAVYTDTDSLIYEIGNSDPYDMMRTDCYHYFDTSDYPTDNIFNIPRVNKKVIGLMKDENNGRIMTDFIGLRSKLYATKTAVSEDQITPLIEELKQKDYESDEIKQIIADFGVSKKAKGVKRNVVKTKITFQDYIDCLETYNEKKISQKLIKSNNHKVYSMEQIKIALSPHDDKRHLIPGTCCTLPLGHYSIQKPMDVD